jgi:hypothetical protein
MQMPSSSTNSQGNRAPSPSHHDIAALAAQTWEKLGRPFGRDMEIWLGAERQLLARRSAGSGKLEKSDATRSKATSGNPDRLAL